MKWEGNRESENVEDRRGQGGGGGGGFGIGGRSIGIGTIVIALIGWGVFGINPLTTIGVLSGSGSSAPQSAPTPQAASNDAGSRFVKTVLASTEDVWSNIFAKSGAQYQAPRLVLFTGATRTACGTGQAAMGPFYCPADYKVYLDMDFFNTMSRQLGAPGEFARAYVVAHEVGHHVQNLLGISGKVDSMRGRISERDQNALSVRLELQADCYAGIWANHSQQAKSWLEQGDIESAINAAQQIGDDKLQRESTGVVRPDSFTHGSSAQRVRWFTQGYKTGSVQSCDTFNAGSL